MVVGAALQNRTESEARKDMHHVMS
jgi:hypothetical protein